ncbi:hypothetical protein Pcinc_032781 [Petrolisthes cinctipes]|uniref:Uncharacterized protein n=1 Tax=Petrolisthes cinctipes TaxID=88211 RepID=A0AAE1K0Q5_PETCI|nr:hypothetical protein Pcinc_032781 [Petrolisthes cinctipes]
MRAVTPSPKTRDVPYGFPSNEGCDSEVCEEEDEPEVECVRGLTGHLHHPAHECYGAVTINILGWQARWLRVGVLGLTGLPWVGGSGGLMVEVSMEPGGRSRWLALPNAHGPKVNVKMETIVKSPREAKMKKRALVKVSVWVCGRMWRHAAIGNALTPIPDQTPDTSSYLPVTLPLRHHTQVIHSLTLIPDTPIPDTPIPDTPIPDTPIPDTPIPDTPIPDTPIPDTPIPDTPIPDTPIPDTPIPDTPIPDTPIPDTPIPDTPIPDTPIPDTPIPDTPIPDTLIPDTPIPDTPIPDTPIPDTPIPDTPIPDTPIPDTLIPDTPIPDTPIPDTPIPDTLIPDTTSYLPVTLPLRHHTQLSEDLGLVELSLRCDYTYATETSVVGSSRGEITITLEVLRAKHLRPHHPRVLARATPSRLRDQVVVVCRVGLWVKGERTARESSTPVRLPVTHDPVIRTRSVFTIQREAVQHATLIIKVLYHSKWAGEDVVGRVQLGPLLYLGTCPDPSQETTPTPDYNTSITLSHWGLALKTPGSTTMWHRLQL